MLTHVSAARFVAAVLILAAVVIFVLAGWGNTFGHYGPGRFEAWGLASGFAGLLVLTFVPPWSPPPVR